MWIYEQSLIVRKRIEDRERSKALGRTISVSQEAEKNSMPPGPCQFAEARLVLGCFVILMTINSVSFSSCRFTITALHTHTLNSHLWEPRWRLSQLQTRAQGVTRSSSTRTKVLINYSEAPSAAISAAISSGLVACSQAPRGTIRKSAHGSLLHAAVPNFIQCDV